VHNVLREPLTDLVREYEKQEQPGAAPETLMTVLHLPLANGHL
jgi:hypothetical protein